MRFLCLSYRYKHHFYTVQSVSPRAILPPPRTVAPTSAPIAPPAPIGRRAPPPIIGGGAPPPPIVPRAPTAPRGGSAHVHARGGGVRPLSDAKVHPDLAAVHFGPSHRLPRLLRVLHVLVVDEGEATRAAGVTVEDNLDLLHRPELAELRLELPLAGVDAQAEDPDTLAGLGVLPVSEVSPPGRHRRARVVTGSLRVGRGHLKKLLLSFVAGFTLVPRDLDLERRLELLRLLEGILSSEGSGRGEVGSLSRSQYLGTSLAKQEHSQLFDIWTLTILYLWQHLVLVLATQKA